MKHLHITLFLLLTLCVRGLSAQGLAGDWQGRLDVGSMKLRLVTHFEQTDGGWSGTLDSPDQGARGIPMDAVTRTDSLVTFTVAALGVRYTGVLRGDSLIDGTFQQGAASLPLRLIRGVEQVRRPQTPRPPFPYRSEEVTLPGADTGVTLAGTLTLPEGGKPRPAVILLTGSGTQDRDETIMEHKPFAVIADCLTRRGFAVLRCDDRGAGRSTGSAASATTLTGAADASCMMDYLKARPEIDPSRIGLLGHSEGAAMAFHTAAQRDDVAFVVSLAGPGVKGDSILLRQNADLARLEGMPEGRVESLCRLLQQVYALAESELPADVLLDRLVTLYGGQTGRQLTDAEREQLRRQLSTFCTPWMRGFLRHDPQTDLKAVRCPVLVLNGERDTQVDATVNPDAIRRALPDVPGRLVTVKRYPGLNHLFQHCTTGLPAEYGSIEETISPEVLADLAAWMEALP